MNMESILGVVRHILTFGGGFLVAKGWLDADTLTQAVAALASLVGVVWSVIAKKNAPTPPAA
jgi:hypothetical protein